MVGGDSHIMTYLKVLQHLKDFRVDRIILDEFTTAWSETGTSTVTVGTTNATINTNSLKIEAITEGDVIYKTPPSPLRLDDRETVQLHIQSTETVAEGDLSLIFSQGTTLSPELMSIDLPALTADTMELVELTIPTPKSLSRVGSVGLKVNTTITPAATLYLSAVQATTTKYITTVEDVEEFITKGENYVLSKLDETTLPTSDSLQEAVYMAAAAKLWMRQKENEQGQWNYGDYNSTKNYGVKLLSDARVLIEQYLNSGSIDETGTGEGTREQLNTDLLGGNSVFDGNIL